MSPQQMLSECVLACKQLTARYLAGFNSLNHTCQAEHLPNHVAWALGHCARSLHQAAQLLDQRELPETDFSPEPCKAATDDPTFCFHEESIAFNSQPVDDPAIYPSFERCVQIYESACDRLAAAVTAASDEQLQREVAWDSAKMPLFLLVSRMIFHTGMHTGQIADLRRAMKMPLDRE